jgi:hypothetical protein
MVPVRRKQKGKEKNSSLTHFEDSLQTRAIKLAVAACWLHIE